MTETTRVPRTELTGVYGGLMKIAMRKMLGAVPEGVEVMWHNQRVFKDTMKFGRKVERWDQLDPNLASYAAMAAASTIGCSFCLDFQYFTLHNKGLDEAKAREVPRWRESAVFTPIERRVLEYAEAVCQTPPAVTDQMVAELLADLEAPALLELTSRIGMMNFAARGNVALGIRSQEFAEACGLQPLATPVVSER